MNICPYNHESGNLNPIIWMSFKQWHQLGHTPSPLSVCSVIRWTFVKHLLEYDTSVCTSISTSVSISVCVCVCMVGRDTDKLRERRKREREKEEQRGRKEREKVKNEGKQRLEGVWEGSYWHILWWFKLLLWRWSPPETVKSIAQGQSSWCELSEDVGSPEHVHSLKGTIPLQLC